MTPIAQRASAVQTPAPAAAPTAAPDDLIAASAGALRFTTVPDEGAAMRYIHRGAGD